MIAKEIKIFKFLVILNSVASIAITHQIILYNLEYLDFKIYFVDYASQADLKIFFVDYKSQAGWQRKGKKHLLY